MFCLELWYSVEKYSVIDAAIQLSAYNDDDRRSSVEKEWRK